MYSVGVCVHLSAPRLLMFISCVRSSPQYQCKIFVWHLNTLSKCTLWASERSKALDLKLQRLAALQVCNSQWALNTLYSMSALPTISPSNVTLFLSFQLWILHPCPVRSCVAVNCRWCFLMQSLCDCCLFLFSKKVETLWDCKDPGMQSQAKAKADDDSVAVFGSFWTAWLKAFWALWSTGSIQSLYTKDWMDPVLHKAHTVLTSAGKVPEFQ